MLQRQVPSTPPIQSGRRVLSAEGWNEEGPLTLAQVPPGPRVPPSKKRRRGNTTGEGGERKNTTRHRPLTQADKGTVRQEGAMPKKRGRLPIQDSGPAGQDGAPTGRHATAWHDGRRIRFQLGKIEEIAGQWEKRKPGARAPEPRA